MKILLSHISVDKTLFEFTGKKDEFDIPELIDDITVKTYAYRSGESYTLAGSFSTKLELKCDRCLEPYKQDIHKDFEVIFTSEDEVDKDDHFMFLPPQDIDIDLKPYICDTINLDIPFRKICSNSCKGLCVSCGANLNYEACTCNNDRIDPRWDSLQKLRKSLESAEE